MSILKLNELPKSLTSITEVGEFLNNPEVYKAQLVRQDESIGGGRQMDVTIYSNEDETLAIGIWHTTAFKSEQQPFTYTEYALVLDGSVVLIEESGQKHTFAEGDIIKVTKGTNCYWNSDQEFKKLYFILSDDSNVHWNGTNIDS